MTKKKQRNAPTDEASTQLGEEQIYTSDLTLHELFQQQTAKLLDRSDLSDEHKQSILVAMSCPCCGAGAMSFTAKLRR